MAVASALASVSVTKALAAAVDYVANDVLSESATVGAVWTFADMVLDNGGKGYITKAQVISETLVLVPKLSLFLFSAAPTSELNDGLPNTALLHADLANYLGRIDFPAMTSFGGDSEAVAVPSAANHRFAFECAAASKNLIGILVTQDAFTNEVAGDDMTVVLTRELA